MRILICDSNMFEMKIYRHITKLQINTKWYAFNGQNHLIKNIMFWSNRRKIRSWNRFSFFVHFMMMCVVYSYSLKRITLPGKLCSHILVRLDNLDLKASNIKPQRLFLHMMVHFFTSFDINCIFITQIILLQVIIPDIQ